MATFVSMLTWSGYRRPQAADIREAVDDRFDEFRDAGLHSLVFLPEAGTCVAVMVAKCEDDDAVGHIAAAICPDAEVRVESMQFDDANVPAWIRRDADPEPPDEYLSAVLEAVVGR